MNVRHRIVCDGDPRRPHGAGWDDAKVLELHSFGPRTNVFIHLHHITKRLTASLPHVALDLIDIASFVYAADQAILRGGKAEFEYGEKWRRHLRFEIPVREPEIWGRSDVTERLSSVLGFLSDDLYEFEFRARARGAPAQAFLFDSDTPDSGFGYEEVMLFSGGLDSFAGAVHEILDSNRKIALISHEPATKVGKVQRDLLKWLVQQNPDRRKQPLHVSVEVNKGKQLNREYTQRTRSFLFVALAAAIAHKFDLDRVRFYENGVVSINLPLSHQVIGGRASRTTHPRALHGFGELISVLFGHEFSVENPFLWKTKTQIVKGLMAAGRGEWCARTVSCAHTWQRTKAHPHCGRCSQCIDRRIIMVAAEASDSCDPVAGYVVDPVRYSYEQPEERALVERYVATARAVRSTSTPLEFFKRFPDLHHTLRFLPGSSSEAAIATHDLYGRHAREVCGALETILSRHASDIVSGEVAPHSLLDVTLQRHRAAAPSVTATTTQAADPLPHLPVADTETYSVKFRGRTCPLGNRLEFRVASRLIESFGQYVSREQLANCWGGETPSMGAMTQAVFNLRRLMQKGGLDALAIDGRTRGAYRMEISSPQGSDRSLIVA